MYYTYTMRQGTGLLVIDMQLCAFDGKITPPICHGDELLATVAELIERCRKQGLPIILAQTCAISGQPYAKDVHGWEIHARLETRPEDKIVYKIQSNAFEDTNLQEVLFELELSRLIICGIWSEYCVANTTLAALSLGYEVCLVADAHGTVAGSDAEAMDAVAKQNEMLVRKGAQVITMSQLSDLFPLSAKVWKV